MQRKNCVFTDFFIVLLSFSVKAQLIKFRLWYRLILYKRNHLSERWTDIDDWQVRRLTPVIICAGYFCSLGFPYISYLEFLCSTLSRAAFYVLHFQRPSLSLYLCFDLQPITLVCSMPLIVLHVFYTICKTLRLSVFSKELLNIVTALSSDTNRNSVSQGPLYGPCCLCTRLALRQSYYTVTWVIMCSWFTAHHS